MHKCEKMCVSGDKEGVFVSEGTTEEQGCNLCRTSDLSALSLLRFADVREEAADQIFSSREERGGRETKGV